MTRQAMLARTTILAAAPACDVGSWSCRAGTEADHDARCATCGRPVWARPLPPPRQTLCDACFDRNYS